MFELPSAKRVRREDLRESSSDAASSDEDDQRDVELKHKLQARFAETFSTLDFGVRPDLDTENVKPSGQKQRGASHAKLDDDGKHDNSEEEFEFRLFSSAKPATKVALPDDLKGVGANEGAMLNRRPLSYYITDSLSPARRDEIRNAAISGEDVLSRAKQRWWGMEMPWRVVEATSSCVTAPSAHPSKDGRAPERIRKRPGKKKRIALRMRERDAKAKTEEKARAEAGKEELMKEKRKRMNRLKKLRKRDKAKEQRLAKQSGQADGHAGQDVDVIASTSGDEVEDD